MARTALDEESLEKAAIDYLGHYASSAGNLRRVLMRRIARAGAEREAAAAAREAIEAVVARLRAKNLLDDRLYAAQLAQSLRRRGGSATSIRARLAEKGVAEDDAKAALAGLGAAAASELAAACVLVRRRRLGPYRAVASRAAFRERDLGVLARAGFGLDLARRVLAARDESELERLAQEEDA
ncbi:MAG TPA: RecX family transcriptional regulator [Stellaceae bacterium]|nr:RecX family transcriptional regulator [Stellaceae bacterium]